MIRRSFLLSLALALLLGPFAAFAEDVVYKTDGGRLRGKITDESRREVTIETPVGKVVVPRNKISRIERQGDAQKQYETRKAKLSSSDAEGFYELGRWCQEQGLAEQALECFRTVVKIAPDHTEARGQLGHHKHDGKWLTEEEWYQARGFVKYDGRWVTVADRDNLAAGLVLVDGRWVTKEEAERAAAEVIDEEPADEPEPREERVQPRVEEKKKPAAEPAEEAEPKEQKKSSRRGKPVKFRVLTFNVRFDFESDGSNRWQYRADLVAKTIKLSQATLVGIQEDKADQVQDLKDRLPEFGFMGLGRNGGQSGEHNSILYRKDEWRLKDNGDFWLSDTPDVQGSNTWGDKYPRKCTWALLEPRDAGDKPVLVLNTHLPEGRVDHLRQKGVGVMRAWLEKRLGGDKGLEKVTILALGDYNSGANTEPQKTLMEGGLFRDAWIEGRASDPSPGTFCDFKGLRTQERIDWILIGGRGRALAAQKIDEPIDGRYPSDHYPVMADVEIR